MQLMPAEQSGTGRVGIADRKVPLRQRARVALKNKSSTSIQSMLSMIQIYEQKLFGGHLVTSTLRLSLVQRLA